MSAVLTFPSPIGELHFSIFYGCCIRLALFVSVPYRGATFLNKTPRTMKGGESTCFRPLSGSYISQSIKQRTNERRNQGFRPLSGSYISQLMAAGFKDTKGKPFPSPIGELHFSMIKCLMHSIIPVLVSVPYRGATFLNGSTPQGLFLRRSRFRPLSGSYISQ